MIGVDLDEVLCPTIRYYCIFLNRKYHLTLREKDFKTYEFYEIYGVTRKEAIKDFIEFTGTEFFMNMQPYPDALEGVKRLKELDDLCLITSRQEYLRGNTLRFLESFFPGVFSKVDFGNLYSLKGEKVGKLALCKKNNVKLLVEDDPRHAREVSREIPVILVNKLWNKSLDELREYNIVRVYNWEGVFEKAQEILL